ncbi:MAG: MBL fold metallo-hydrolase [Candidatus Calescibacterium sp.]|nr:MBL fold metallo-hydrolase [Candidatus Calescibacterium sp.]MCX7971988.1 MBL fold metallo-hydrolase [bacterium]MDW8195476.1 MBL fold metallo-hydrolase [Candidatus Calescibacterium sp.]
MNNQRTITPEQLYEKMRKDEKITIIDLRSPEKYNAHKIEGKNNFSIFNIYYAQMLESGDLDKDMTNYIEKNFPTMFSKNEELYIVCDQGSTSEIFTKNLLKLGYNAYNIQGGMQNWFNYYDYKTVVESPELSIYQISRISRGDLSWVIISNGEATIIDPLRHVEKYTDFINQKGAKIKFILDTHIHADHISGGPKLSRMLNVPYYFHPYDAIHPIDVMIGKVQFSFAKEGDVLTLGSAKIKVLHVPGHTLGNLVYLVNDKYLFTGDTIFIQSVARPDLGGRGETWAPMHADSLYRLVNLGDDILVLPAHFSKISEANNEGLFVEKLGVLKKSNEALSILINNGKEEFVKYILSSLPTFPKEYIDIKRVNIELIEVDEERAQELETGKNICALSQAYVS